MRHHLYMDIIPRIRDTSDECADDGREDEELRHGGVGEARGYHRGGWGSVVLRSGVSVRSVIVGWWEGACACAWALVVMGDGGGP